MKNFLQPMILLLILMLISLFKSPFPYMCIMLSGALMLVFTMMSVEDNGDEKSLTGFLMRSLQIILSILFSILSEGFYTFIILFEYRLKKQNWVRILLPPLCGFAYEFLRAAHMKRFNIDMPNILLESLMLLALSSVMYFIEKLVEHYCIAQSRIHDVIIATAVSEMTEKKHNRELMFQNYIIEQNAKMEERENISRNIHNSVGHSITAAIMTLDAADMLFDAEPERAREKMNLASKRIHGSLEEIRKAVRVLDEENDYVEVNSLIGGITKIANDFETEANVRVNTILNHSGEMVMVSKKHTKFLEEAMKELLTNGVKHGNADKFVISLSTDSRHISLKVTDNGKSGFDSENSDEKIRNGFGLKKIISYVEHCGGKTAFENKNGFSAEIVLILNRTAEN